MMKMGVLSCIVLLAGACAAAEEKLDLAIADGPFKADVESLKQYRCPEWFRDAKFGIWAHWGPQAVPRHGDWYARKMYQEGSDDYKHHLAIYGHPSKSGYKDIVSLWKANKWEPDRLMELYAIALGWPADGKVAIRSLAAPNSLKSVKLLGYAGRLEWAQTKNGLEITLPQRKVSDIAIAFEIIGENLQPTPVSFDNINAIAGLPSTVADYRRLVKSTDLATYSRAALALRKWMIENDPSRPLYHFTGVESWINDPNGPIYHGGKYHLFYQFDPQVPDGHGGWRRSKRCWGHAVSSDLVHWVDWPVAVWPDTRYDRNGVYSGNTFIQEGKIHGLYTGNGGEPGEIYGMLTWSDDGGVTFKKKMVMSNDQRPNKNSPVHWDAQVWKDGDAWCQLIGGATETPKRGAAWLWKSKDLHNWQLAKNIAPSIRHGDYWELPYLVPLDGRYVLMVGRADNPYWIGRYDRKAMEFTPDTPVRSVDTGDYYSFNPHMVDDKGPNGSQRRIMHGWATIGRPPAIDSVPYWESAHSIPRVISIKDDRLWQEPIPELQCLRYDHQNIAPQNLPAGPPMHLPSVRGDALEILASFNRKSAKRCGLIVRADRQGKGTTVWADAGNRFGIENRANAHLLKASEPLDLRVFVDRGVIEVYCNGVAVTHKCFAPPDRIEVFAFSEGSEAKLKTLEAWKMKSMWE